MTRPVRGHNGWRGDVLEDVGRQKPSAPGAGGADGSGVQGVDAARHL